MATGIEGRPLHFVFKASDRAKCVWFYKEILGMKVLRHEELNNGTYANRWSKTMLGYGPEDSYFIIELVYYYGFDNYSKKANDFVSLTIKSSEIIKTVKTKNWPFNIVDGKFMIEAPGSYEIYIVDEAQPEDRDPVQKLTLTSSDLNQTTKFWNKLLGMKIKERDDNFIVLCYDDNQCMLEFINIGHVVTRSETSGRLAFAVPKLCLPNIQEKMKETKQTILTALTPVEVPGKATITIVMVADSDGHELVLVDDEGFRLVSQVHPQAEEELTRYISTDTYQVDPQLKYT